MSLNQLKEAVLQNSIAKTWHDAVTEWTIVGFDVDHSASTTCICGHPGIKYLYQIYNSQTEKYLYPVGSCCIKKFDLDVLSDFVDAIEAMAKLLEKVKNNEWIDLKWDFSRRLLDYLYETEMICEEDDYLFLLKMFNKRTRMSIAQDKKVKAIILSEIVPKLGAWIHQLKPKRSDVFALIISGTRTFWDYQLFTKVTDYMTSRIKYPLKIISGGAKGADSLAERYARTRGIEIQVIPADWDAYGKRAGYVRNRKLYGEACGYEHRGSLCFWDGESLGTQQHFDLAEEYNTALKVWNYQKGIWI